MGLTIPGAETSSLQQSANLAHQLQLIKDLLFAPITALVDDSSKIKNIDCVGLPLACLYQYIRICSHLMLYWAFCIGDVFSCILNRELQSTRVHVYAIKEFLNDELPGWCWTLMDSGKPVLIS